MCSIVMGRRAAGMAKTTTAGFVSFQMVQSGSVWLGLVWLGLASESKQYPTRAENEIVTYLEIPSEQRSLMLQY